MGAVARGKLKPKEAMVRGHRIALLSSAVAPLRGKLGKARAERLTQALSLVFGTEAFVVLKDIWHLDRDGAEEVALWTCHALIRCAAEDLAPPVRRRKVNGSKAERAQERRTPLTRSGNENSAVTRSSRRTRPRDPNWTRAAPEAITSNQV